MYYEIALLVNKCIFDNNLISYNLYKTAENKLLEKIKKD